IYFNSVDEGWVTTVGDGSSASHGGAVFKAKAKSVTSVLFSGNRDGLCQIGMIDFFGIDKTPDGFVALAQACDVIASHDGGKTFDIEKAQSAGVHHGIEK